MIQIGQMVYLAGVLLLTACGSSTSDEMSQVAESIEWRGTITDALAGSGLENATVCTNAPGMECVSTDAEGAYLITGPANAEVMLTVSAPDYLPSLLFVPDTMTSGMLRPVALLTRSLQGVQESLVGVETNDDNGGIVFGISNGISGDRINVPDGVVRLEPTDGAGPFYTGTSGLPQQDLDATSAHGGGLFSNVGPGDYTLTFEELPGPCVVLFGWGSPDRIRLRVEPGHVSIVRIECSEDNSARSE